MSERARRAAEELVGALDLVGAVDDELLASAARLEPPALRSLDAIHVATALLLGDALGLVVAYDERMLAAARAAGLPAAAPAPG